MKHLPAFVSLVLCLFPSLVSAYEPTTHKALSSAAVAASVLADAQKNGALGLHDISDERHTYLNSEGNKNTVLELIRDGANFEDDGVRSLNHFFDPRTGSALYFDPARFPDVSSVELLALNALNQTSPDWALGTLHLPHLPQSYSYTDLKDYYVQSLTNTNNTQRAQATGLAFETLGRVIHHVQDMAQPAHVRNDQHVQYDAMDRDCFIGPTLVPAWVCDTYRKLLRPSFIEKWTLQLTSTGLLPELGGYPPVYGPGAGADGYSVFTAPRLLWTNDGKGMADFTNRNFLSEGTMTEAGAPFLGQPFTMRVGDLCNGMVPPCGDSLDPDAMIKFWPSVVDDQFRTVSLANPFAASESIFTPDLQHYNLNNYNEFTINRATLAYDLTYLLPRAVGYSAGLINYFFRGDMEITLPDEGVYSIIDQSPSGCGDPCGFRTLKLKLKNVTPGNEAMGAGSLLAVAKYHLNNCYRPDLSGEDGGTNFLGNSCRSAEEYISVSAPQPVGAVRSDQPQQIPFDFKANPIPINASDVFLQVVFRGQLGQETDAVAVATKDISEPTYYGLENTTDYVFDDLGDQQYHPLPYHSNTNKLKVTNIRIAIGPDAATNLTIASLDSLDGGEHAHLALLMDTGLQSDSISWGGDFGRPPDLVGFDPGEFTQDDTGLAAGVYERNCDLVPYRGLYIERGNVFINLAQGSSQWRTLGSDTRPLTGMPLSVTAGAQRLQPQAARLARCSHAPATGMNDLSIMTPFSPATAKAWNIHF